MTPTPAYNDVMKISMSTRALARSSTLASRPSYVTPPFLLTVKRNGGRIDYQKHPSTGIDRHQDEEHWIKNREDSSFFPTASTRAC
jgi:hypothetical protein